MNDIEPRAARRRIWGWWFFDWAAQPYATLLMTFVFSIYFAEVAKGVYAGRDALNAGAAAQALWGYGLSLSGVAIALLAPVLGAVADQTGRRIPWIVLFSAMYVIGAAGLWVLMPSGHGLIAALVFFGIGLVGMEFATIFTNALMPGLAPRKELGHISGAGFAFGYAGGVMALVLMLALFAESPATGRTLIGLAPGFGLLDPALREGTRFVGPFTAIWYLVFMIPFFLWVREPRRPRRPLRLGAALGDLARLVGSLRRRRSLAAWLASSMFSRDALNALYAFGGVYAGTVLGWPVIWAGVFGVVSAVAAAAISWLGGLADRAWGPRPVIAGCTLVLVAVCVLLVGMGRESLLGVALAPGSRLPDALFMACGVAIGGAGGALQAASRTMMVRHTTPDRATEGFGLYALSGKATAFLAPFLIAVVTQASGSARIGVSPLIVMFIVSLFLLGWVEPEGEQGQ